MESINNTIVEEIYRNGWLEKHCRSACQSSDLMDDLMQEICLIILEYKNQDMLQSLYDRNEHYPFIKRIINNQYKSTTSPFWTKYRKHQVNQCEIIDDMLGGEEDEYLEY